MKRNGTRAADLVMAVAGAAVVVMVAAALTGTTMVGGWSNPDAPSFAPVVSGLVLGGGAVAVIALLVSLFMVRR